MTPDQKRTAAIALGELHAAYLALDAALSRLHTPVAEDFMPPFPLAELMQARDTVRRVQEGLHGLVTL